MIMTMLVSALFAMHSPIGQQSLVDQLKTAPAIVKKTDNNYQYVGNFDFLKRNDLKSQEKKESTLSPELTKGGYTAKYVVTAYSTHPSENGGYTITSTGKTLGKGIIAVDPRHIPMGSRIYVPGYGWGEAQDVGGMIKGRHIDVCLPSRGSVGRWGKRRLEIIIVPKKKNTPQKE